MCQASNLRPDILAYLEGWYAKSARRQTDKGNRFLLSFDEFLDLWGARRIRSLERWMDDGSLFVRQRRHTPQNPNPNGYVLTYTSFAASKSGEMNAHNAQVCTRGKGLQDCRMGKGDRHSHASRAAISNALRGVEKTPEHRQNISRAMTGIKRGPMSQAERDKRAAGVRSTLAAKRANR